MKRKPLRAIEIVNHMVRREASKGGLPEYYAKKATVDLLHNKPVKQLTKAARRKK